MATYICKISDGTLVSYNPGDSDPVGPNLAARGLEAHPGLLPLDSTHQWDAPSKSVVVVASTASNQISPFAFWLLFTAAEIAGIRASSDSGIQRFLFAIASGPPMLDLSGNPMRAFINLCVSLGLLGAGRGAAILASGS